MKDVLKEIFGDRTVKYSGLMFVILLLVLAGLIISNP